MGTGACGHRRFETSCRQNFHSPISCSLFDGWHLEQICNANCASKLQFIGRKSFGVCNRSLSGNTRNAACFKTWLARVKKPKQPFLKPKTKQQFKFKFLVQTSLFCFYPTKKRSVGMRQEFAHLQAHDSMRLK